jgi:hypothetical protein
VKLIFYINYFKREFFLSSRRQMSNICIFQFVTTKKLSSLPSGARNVHVCVCKFHTYYMHSYLLLKWLFCPTFPTFLPFQVDSTAAAVYIMKHCAMDTKCTFKRFFLSFMSFCNSDKFLFTESYPTQLPTSSHFYLGEGGMMEWSLRRKLLPFSCFSILISHPPTTDDEKWEVKHHTKT